MSRARPAGEVARTLRAAGGDVTQAAALAGCTVETYRKRASRAGVSLPQVQYAMAAAAAVPDAGEAALAADGTVTLTLTDYAVLQHWATLGREWGTQERIIARLTATLEALGPSRA